MAGDLLPALVEPVERLLGGRRDRRPDATRGAVPGDRDRAACAPQPRLAQGVTEEGKSARGVPDLGRDQGGESGLDLQATPSGWQVDGAHQIGLVERPQQHLTGRQPVRELAEHAELTVEVGAHGDDEPTRVIAHEIHARRPRAGVVAEREQLFQLVDDQDGARALVEIGVLEGASRVAARTDDDAVPERGRKPGEGQRRLAAAGGADDGDEPVGREELQAPVDGSLAAEEQVGVKWTERRQAGVGAAAWVRGRRDPVGDNGADLVRAVQPAQHVRTER